MELLVLVLNDSNKLEDVLESLNTNGVTGGTVIDSTGMQTALHDEETAVFAGAIRSFFGSASRSKSHTIFMVLNKEQVSVAISAIEAVTGDLNNENVGIIFSIPVDFVKGIHREP